MVWEPKRRAALRPRTNLYEERQREIDRLYAAGYGKHPQEAWVGELGSGGFTAFDRGEGGAPL
jgi:hypothetical protein